MSVPEWVNSAIEGMAPTNKLEWMAGPRSCTKCKNRDGKLFTPEELLSLTYHDGCACAVAYAPDWDALDAEIDSYVQSKQAKSRPSLLKRLFGHK